MSDKHPYFQSPGHFTQLIGHLRKTFPSSVTADTLKKLGLARKNESYIVNTLRFLELIDEAGNRTELAQKIFSMHQDKDFQEALSAVVKKTYPELFSLHGEDAWSLQTGDLITFFRQNDQSSASVGKFQAGTFKCLSALSGHGEIAPARAVKQGGAAKKITATKTKAASSLATPNKTNPKDAPAKSFGRSDVGLTVRVEINLPAEGDQETYDRIFKSIRENLLNG